MVGHQLRDASPSPPPRERPRNVKTLSMPLVPSITSFAGQQGSQIQRNPSPTLSGTSARRSPPPGSVSRLLPTPPHPNPPNFDDRRLSPPPGPQHSHSQPTMTTAHYGRAPHRAPIPQYQAPNVDEKWHQLDFGMTPELLADIERAADQQYQASASQHAMPYSSGTTSPAKDANVERVRATPDRSSPTHTDNAQRARREQQLARESPQARDRPAPSPNMPFSAGPGPAQPQSGHSPELQQQKPSPGQNSPNILPNIGEPHPASYLAMYNAREQATVSRRQTVGGGEIRTNPSMASQTPPLQTIHNRNPGRSLPVQEEDEVLGKNGMNGRSNWQLNDQNPEKTSSPTPSSDLNPEGQREPSSSNTNDNSKQRPDHRDLSTPALSDDDSLHSQYVDRDTTSEDATFTPKSPTVGLPLDTQEVTYQNGVHNPVPQTAVPRNRGRNSTGDQVMRGMDGVIMNGQGAEPPQHNQSQAPEAPHGNGNRQQPQVNTGPYQGYPPEAYGYAPQNGAYGSHPSPQIYYADEFYGDDIYYQHYLRSPRPSAPIPPTPHSQTAAPSPSPNLAAQNAQDYEQAPYPPVPPLRVAGSPFPFPYNHMRRNMQGYSPAPQNLREQMAKQYQKYAQNNQGYVTDSTLSPSSTPFRPDLMYHAWAMHHTKKNVGPASALDNASITSSPSHKPIELSFTGFRGRKERPPASRSRQAYPRQPPPRVESTQPRETSPELSSSGEETAGDDRPDTAMESHIDETPHVESAIPIESDDDNGEWVDEDEEDDYEDLIDLEYHPSFVKNISKRRRKWEVGWENLIQAFQALDRQTDATMVLLASPSHTTKLHGIRSRSIRRQPILATSVNMNQIRSGFSHIAAQRRATRPDKTSLVERFMAGSSSSGGDGSDGSSGSLPENLRRVLDAALGEVYEQREARVLEELQRSREDRERVELLLRQVLGDRDPLSLKVTPDY
ncbi:hypothetical protein D9619_001281 [Psilocybe cf. subviscida]|uniref:Uncharacterized protein n=1 Tax=Psilocybe cf. subviscida TaxID=2480587 RepID=A0A8H5BFX4_9AGAR|nr:hypothetical protein D9619_001281 [Psilocybe cf. subviscida]